MNDFLSKPIDPTKLELILNRWIPKSKRVVLTTTQPVAEEKSKEINKTITGTITKTKTQAGITEVSKPSGNSHRNDNEIDGLDMKAGIERVVGNEAIYREILKIYIETTPPVLDELRQPTAETLKNYAVAIHGIKGSSLNIGAEKVGKMAAALEMSAKAGNLEAVLADNETFIKTTEKLLADMELFLEKNS
jgi:HPt (histidine-containing phosphotransfer) domain-containing protein